MNHERAHARCGCGLLAHSTSAHAGARPFALASSTKHYERDRPFALMHLDLDGLVDFPSKRFVASCTLSFRRIDKTSTTVELDAIGFEVKHVRLDKSDAIYTYDGQVLRVTVPRKLDTFSVTITYTAYPRRGMYFLEPDSAYPSRPRQVWTQCQEDDARHFVPCHDAPHTKMTSAIRVTVPEGYTALSNGDLVRRDVSRGLPRFAFVHAEPHSSYLLTIVVGQFDEYEETYRGVALRFLAPKGKLNDARASFANTRKMFEVFETKTGVPYPWKSYAQVVVSDFIFGGMENTTATTLYEHVVLDARARLDMTSDDLIAHELAHQWFGDLVTCRDWSHGWLNEGFATYFEHIWREAHLGLDEFHYGLLTDLHNYAAEARGRYRRPVVCAEYDAPLDLFDRHLYEKGGLFLHTLRVELGDAVFFAGVRAYLQRHGKGLVETRDLLRGLESESGKSLERMFDEALYRPGHPELEVELTFNAAHTMSISVRQVQATADQVPAAFAFPLWVEWAEAPSAKKAPPRLRRGRFWVDKRSETFTLPFNVRPLYVVVDPDMRVLGELNVTAPADMLREQLKRGTTARARWLAAQSMASLGDRVTEAALADALLRESEFWGVRAECAAALARGRSAFAHEVLERGLGVQHPKVRRAVVSALGIYGEAVNVDKVRPLAERDASYFVAAEALRTLGKSKGKATRAVLERALRQPSWADVVAQGAVDGLVATRDEGAVETLIGLTKYGYATRVRRAALLGLPKLADGRKVREALEAQLNDADPYLRIDAVRALVDLGDPKAKVKLAEHVDRDLDARARRRMREALRDLGGDGKRALTDLRDELEKLRAEVTKLTRAQVLTTDHGKRDGGAKKRASSRSKS
jgi:aminopeptidase N